MDRTFAVEVPVTGAVLVAGGHEGGIRLAGQCSQVQLGPGEDCRLWRAQAGEVGRVEGAGQVAAVDLAQFTAARGSSEPVFLAHLRPEISFTEGFKGSQCGVVAVFLFGQGGGGLQNGVALGRWQLPQFRGGPPSVCCWRTHRIAPERLSSSTLFLLREIGEPGALAPGCCAFHPGANAPGSPENRSISRSQDLSSARKLLPAPAQAAALASATGCGDQRQPTALARAAAAR